MPRTKASPKISKKLEKSVKNIVQEELKEELEEKHCIVDYDRTLSPQIDFGDVRTNANFFKLMPEITQSTTGEAGRAYNTRIGNEIKLKSLDIKGFINYGAERALSEVNSKIAVRVMILRSRKQNDQESAFNSMPTDTLIRFGNFAAGTPNGASTFDGFPLDAFRDINRDSFAVRYDKTIYLAADRVVSGSTSVTTTYTPSGLKMFSHKMNFGKNGLKLKYSLQGDTEANNFPYFMVIGYSSMAQNIVPTDNLIDCSVSCVGTYTDA